MKPDLESLKSLIFLESLIDHYRSTKIPDRPDFLGIEPQSVGIISIRKIPEIP